MSDTHSITIVGAYANSRELCAFIVAGARAAGFPEKTLFRLELACDEACTNIIEHAYGGEGKGEITGSYAVLENNFVVTLRDRGQAFDPAAVRSAIDSYQEGDPLSLQVGGLGMHIMNQVMDQISYHFEPDGHNLLTMKKRLDGEASDAD